ncbi:MAG: adenylate cyclase, partial [Hyphomicrobium sp.]
VFAIEDDIAGSIATTLAGFHGVILQEGLSLARRKPPSELGSYDCVLLAMEFSQTLSLESHRTTRDCLEGQVDVDPDYARLWANLSIIYVNE